MKKEKKHQILNQTFARLVGKTMSMLKKNLKDIECQFMYTAQSVCIPVSMTRLFFEVGLRTFGTAITNESGCSAYWCWGLY